MSFRLNWTLKQIISINGHRAQRRALSSPLKFYAALILKLVPNLYSKPISLDLKNGQVIIIKDFMSLYIYKEIFIDGCYDELPTSTNSPTIVDVGGNTGLFVLKMKSLYPESKIYSYEPYPPNFEQLNETISMNKLMHVISCNQAIADQSGTLRLFIHPTNIGGHSLYKDNAGNNSVDVQSITLSEALISHSIEHCDILKLDCEGAEYPILKSLTSDLARRIGAIVYEPTPNQYSVTKLNSHLGKLGYSIKRRQGIIIAYRSNSD